MQVNFKGVINKPFATMTFVGSGVQTSGPAEITINITYNNGVVNANIHQRRVDKKGSDYVSFTSYEVFGIIFDPSDTPFTN